MQLSEVRVANGKPRLVHVEHLEILVDNHGRQRHVVEVADQIVQSHVDACDDLPIGALMLGGIGPRDQLPFHCSPGQHVGVRHQRLYRGLHRAHGVGQHADFILAIDIELEAEIARSHFFCAVHQFSGRAGDAARHPPSEHRSHQDRRNAQHDDQHLRLVGNGDRRRTGLLHVGGLIVNQFVGGGEVGTLALAQFSREQTDCFVPLAGFLQFEEPALIDLVGLARLGQFGESLLALLAMDSLGQLVEVFVDDFGCARHAVEFPGGLVALRQQGITQGTGDYIDLVANIVGPDGLGKLVIDQVIDIVADLADALVGDSRDNHQQNEHETEAQTEPGADFQILEHGVSPLNIASRARAPMAVHGCSSVHGFVIAIHSASA